jgi:UrcA family protein
MSIRRTFFAAFVGLIAVAPVAASASEPTSHIVRYSDLNLSSKAGQAALDRRINRAVRMVCGTAASVALQDKLNVQKCYATARASAKAQMTEKG